MNRLEQARKRLEKRQKEREERAKRLPSQKQIAHQWDSCAKLWKVYVGKLEKDLESAKRIEKLFSALAELKK